MFYLRWENVNIEAARAAKRCVANVHELATEHCAELTKSHYVDTDIPEDSWLDWDLIEE